MNDHDKSKPQVDKFKEAARQLEADEDEAAFNAKLRKLVKQKADNKKRPKD